MLHIRWKCRFQLKNAAKSMENGQNMLQTVANTVENTMENERFELKTVAHTVEMAVSSSKMLQIAWKMVRTGNPKKIPQTRKKSPNNFLPFSKSVCFYESQPLDKDSSRSFEDRDCTTQVSQGLTKKDRLPDCWCRRSSFFFVLCSVTFHLKIKHFYFLTIQVGNSLQMMS